MAKRRNRIFSTMISLLLHGGRRTPLSSSCPSGPVQRDGCPPPTEDDQQQTTLLVDVDTALLRSGDDTFPYFMLVALEAGGFLRGLLLLLLYPLLFFLPATTTRAVMAFVAFCGLRATRFRAGRAVLPKWFMDDVAAEAFEAVSSRRVVCVSRGMPRVMVDGFLREYLGADAVVGRGMKTLWGFYTGLFMEDEEELVLTDDGAAAAAVIGFSGSSEFLKHPLARSCKEVYVTSRRRPLPPQKKKKTPTKKPVVFHDGRLAFRPTPANTLAMFAWIPFGILLGAARLAVALTVPYRYSTPILAATGMSWRLKGPRPPLPRHGKGQLFVCNHRTLIDPVYVSVALDRPVRAVSYSLSRLSELISPIGRTVRLTRDRRSDGEVMARLLAGGDFVVVCPEGTTCREPYLLRFSPLFAELADDVVPVGIAVETSMFYATTAGGLKCFDPLYYMVNPRMCYTVQFLDKVDTKAVRDGDAPSTDVANRVQKKMGDALGYGCTMLTRKDKYLVLAGNDGIVNNKSAVASSSAPAAASGRKNKNN